ncbi:MAG: DUF4268 domain-containing protein [Opitutales bacterium]|nr:DUF4268 domain-containing protein [Opitutales bacterium]
MSLYRVTTDKLEAVDRTTFAEAGVFERRDLQRMLRKDISPIGDDLMVIAEEFGDWEDSNRRIDLLCLDKGANLVVVEIKRTQDGGHMDLQALRYAAMVSSMTLEQAIDVFAQTKGGDAEEARGEVLGFLQLDSVDEAELTGDVRIVLVSADFSAEITTAVLWLNQRELDIRCIRLLPYRLGGELLIDATQINPLPEAEAYAVKLRKQAQEKRKVLGLRQQTLMKFWEQFIERSKPKTSLLANRSTTKDHWLSAGIGKSHFTLNVLLTRQGGQVECYISGGEEKSKAAFAALQAQKPEIEERFGDVLDWQELPGKQGCRICKTFPGGWTTPESDWPELQDRLLDNLIRLERALRERVQEL